MIAHPDIEPTAFYILGWPVHWYGLMYLLSFAAAFAWGRRLLRRRAFADLRGLTMDDMLFAGVVGVIVGGRLGYVLFYNPAFYAAHPAQIARLWDGGMSFHGGLLGVVAALFIYARRSGLPFLRTTDFAAALAPLGLGLGRIGNFINGELPGRVAPPDLPWAMIFPGDSVARHPSPLYQAFLEGAVLFFALQWFAARRRPPGFLSGVFLLGYGLFRLISELFREPDAHLGFIFGGVSMGQLLSFPMLLGGVALLLADKWIPAAQARLSAFARAAANSKKTAKNVSQPAEEISDSESDAADSDAPPAPQAADSLPPPADDSEFAKDDDESEVENDGEGGIENEGENETESSAAAAPSLPWWKKLFAAKNAESPPPSRRRSRREARRQKKKRRR